MPKGDGKFPHEGDDMNMPDFDSIDGDLQADMDQAAAHIYSLTPLIAVMYRGLREQGVGSLAAAALTAAHFWYWGNPHPGLQQEEEGDGPQA